jgi:transcriptional regulator with XRE-family HTH domain
MIDFSDLEEKSKSQAQAVIGRLREERRKANISQMELSFASGLSQNQVNAIETGKQIPNLITLLKICNALQLNPRLLFGHDNLEELKMYDETTRKKAKKILLEIVERFM